MTGQRGNEGAKPHQRGGDVGDSPGGDTGVRNGRAGEQSWEESGSHTEWEARFVFGLQSLLLKNRITFAY